MTFGGWMMMIVMVGVITWLSFWCILKVVKNSTETKHIHSPTEVDMPDLHDDDV